MKPNQGNKSDEIAGGAGGVAGANRPRGKHILTLMTYLPVSDIKQVWREMDRADRLKFFGNGHAQEIDLLVKQLGTRPTSHLRSTPFGSRLDALHSGAGMDDHAAATVLHDPSGVRLAHRAVSLPPGSPEHNTTMGILNGRYRSNQKEK